MDISNMFTTSVTDYIPMDPTVDIDEMENK
jgi:hypothetical protein